MSAKTLDTALVVFELANRAYKLMKAQEPAEQRRMLDLLLSNSVWAEGRLTVTWENPFDILANWPREAKADDGDSVVGNRRHSEWSAQLDDYRTSMSWSAPSSLDVTILVLRAMVAEDLARTATSSPAPP